MFAVDYQAERSILQASCYIPDDGYRRVYAPTQEQAQELVRLGAHDYTVLIPQERHAGMVMVRPESAQFQEFLDEYHPAGQDTTYLGECLVIEGAYYNGWLEWLQEEFPEFVGDMAWA